MKNKRTALFHSIVSLLLCVSMLVGTTFAWFTDSVTTGINTIASGVLDVELYHSNAAVSNERVDSNTKLFMDLQGKPILWEPGVVSYENLRITNEGDLALAYQLAINTANENYIIDLSGAQYGLSQILKVGVVENGITATDRAGVVASVEDTNWTTLANFLRNGSLLPEGEGESEKTWGIVIYWEPGENDNLWNLNNGKRLNEGTELSIDLGVKLIATQMESESDSFNNEYDSNAKAEFFPGFQGGSADVAVTANDEGLTTDEVAMDGGDVSAVIPAGVHVAEGTNTLALSVNLKGASEANIQLSENEEMRPLDVHIDGVAAGNTTPMLITLKHYLSTGINTGALRLYHVENGVPVAMTQVANPINHNEFSYDPLTGDVTLALASFSEVAVIANNDNTWNGDAEAWTGSGTEADPYLIATAGHMAHFRNLVDGGNTFAGKYVKLNNNITLSNVNFDPIGWGYDYDGYTPNGMTFNGTFDGGNNFIFNLKQNGWEENDCGKTYSYGMDGGGLFASVVDATIQNLKISGADIVMECIDMGVLVGYSQGNCKYINIEIYNAKIANYQRSTGGVVGEVTCRRDENGKPVYEESVHTFENVKVHNDVVVGSLWGDFDASCGGVIGGRWDKDNTTKVVMDKVDVRCRLDVYNDVTAAYQWHAYRRAGMLIGNTDLGYGENRLAQAPFLTCTNVDIYYGDWANYTYCQFTNQSDASGNGLWYNNYPWVRVQAGENCSAYSNVRYGHPIINGNAVTDGNHSHDKDNGDECGASRPFNQLYGGGQGVYGQHTHPGVTVKNYRYSITYVNDSKVLAIKYVTDGEGVINPKDHDDQAEKLVAEWADKNITGSWEFGGWMNAGSTKVENIAADNTKDIVLYPYFNKPYTARFVDQQGNVIAWCLFHAEDLSMIEATKETAEDALPNPGEDLEFDYWAVQITDNEGNVTSSETYDKSKFAGYTHDVTIYPVYLYKGDVNLVPVDNDSDGIVNYYQVAGYSNPDGQAMVEIPASVNGIPIRQINENAFSSYDGVHSIVVPNGVTIGKNAFTSGNSFGRGEEITIYFEGTKAQWDALEKLDGWNYGIGTNSRVFFIKDGKVNTEEGYLEVNSNKWVAKTDFAAVKEQYTGHCDCKESTTGDNAHIYVDANGNVMKHNDAGTPVNNSGVEIYLKESGALFWKEYTLTDGSNTYYRFRPDAIYWEDVTVN